MATHADHALAPGSFGSPCNRRADRLVACVCAGRATAPQQTAGVIAIAATCPVGVGVKVAVGVKVGVGPVGGRVPST